MSNQEKLTNVSATGVAEADYDVVRFTVTIEGKGKTGPAAKEDARPGIDATTAAIAELEKQSINVDRTRFKATNKVVAVQEYDHQSRKNKKEGYQATYTVTFSSTSVNRASDIQDRLTSIPNAQVDEPDFKILDLLGLQRDALEDAKKKVDQRFSDQCAILGIREADCSLASYDARYDDSESAGARPMRASLELMSDSGSGGGRPPPVEIKAGKARVKATLTVTYQRKAASRKAATKASASTKNNGDGKPAAATRTATAG